MASAIMELEALPLDPILRFQSFREQPEKSKKSISGHGGLPAARNVGKALALTDSVTALISPNNG